MGVRHRRHTRQGAVSASEKYTESRSRVQMAAGIGMHRNSNNTQFRLDTRAPTDRID